MKKITNKMINYIKENYIFFLILISLLIILFMHIPNYIYPSEASYSFSFYHFNYDKGFLSRGLMGTIFKLIWGKVTYKRIFYTTMLLVVSLITFVSYLINKLIKKYDKSNNILIISLLLIFNPASFMLMLINSEFGRLDYFLFFNAIISLILLYKNKCLYLIPIISFISMCIHQNFIFYYAPLICAIMLYEGINNKDYKKIKYLLLNIFTLLVALILIYTIGKNTGYSSYLEHYSAISAQTDYVVQGGSLYWEFYQSLSEGIKFILSRATSNQNIFDWIYACISLLIYINILYSLVFKHIKFKNQWLTILVLIAPLSNLLLFFIGADYGRWFQTINTGYAMLSFYILYKYKNEIMPSIKKINITPYVFALIIFIILFQSTNFYYLTFDKINSLINKIIIMFN